MSFNAVNINMQWIPGDLQSVADDIRKFINYDDYMIMLLTTYGVHIPARRIFNFLLGVRISR